MNEAKYSINIKLNLEGYDSRITMRSDDDFNALFSNALSLIQALPKSNHNGNGNGNGKAKSSPPAAQSNGEPKTCPSCGSIGGPMLIKWTDKNTGEPRSAWKCQDCQTWLR